MGDPNDGIGWLMQCGISYLFDPDIEGAAQNGCAHMLLSPLPRQRFTVRQRFPTLRPQHNACALCGEQPGSRLAQPATRARDDDDFSFDVLAHNLDRSLP